MRIIAQVAQSVVSDFLTSPLTSASPTLDANVILDNLITSIREDMKKRWGDFRQIRFVYNTIIYSCPELG